MSFSGTTDVTLDGHRFTTSNAGEGPMTWSASASGQGLTFTYTATGVRYLGTKAFGSACFAGDILDAPDYAGTFTACWAP